MLFTFYCVLVRTEEINMFNHLPFMCDNFLKMILVQIYEGKWGLQNAYIR